MTAGALLDRARGSRARVVIAGPSADRLASALTSRGGGNFESLVLGCGGASPESHPRYAEVAGLLRERKPERVRDGVHALDLASEPLRLGAGLIALGEADALVGAGVSTAELTDAAGWLLGAPRDGQPQRAAHWLLLPDGRLFAVADCVGAHSLDGGARAALAELLAAAHARVSDREPSVAILGGTDSPADEEPLRRFPQEADVLIFPGSVAGHLALGFARALAGGLVLGPMLLGLSGVVIGATGDASEDELAGTAALAALVAGPEGT